MTHLQDRIAAQSSDVVAYRQPSHGTFSINARVSYLFGFPESVSFPGVVMDIDKLTFSTEAKDNCWSKWTDFNKASGSRSSLLENQVLEKPLNYHGWKGSGYIILDPDTAAGVLVFQLGA